MARVPIEVTPHACLHLRLHPRQQLQAPLHRDHGRSGRTSLEAQKQVLPRQLHRKVQNRLTCLLRALWVVHQGNRTGKATERLAAGEEDRADRRKQSRLERLERGVGSTGGTVSWAGAEKAVAPLTVCPPPAECGGPSLHSRMKTKKSLGGCQGSCRYIKHLSVRPLLALHEVVRRPWP